MGRMNPKFLAILLGITLFICGGCEEEVIIPESSLSVSPSGPTATPDHPAVVSADQPVEISFSQKSSYMDSNGYLVDCEPHASIKVTVSKKTIHAKSLAELLAMSETTKVDDVHGNAPQSHRTEQTFQIGGQTVNFTLAYENYSYKNVAGQVMNMPYVLINKARWGEVNSDVLKYGGPHEVTPVTAVRIRSISPTRGSIMLEDLYEVVASFNLDVETIGEKTTNKQTYAFEVSYTATVERIFDYPDPTTTFDYSFSVAGSTTSIESPFVIKKGEDVQLEWNSRSTHTWYDTDVMGLRLYEEESFARADVSSTIDTISTYSFRDIKDMIPTSIEEPVISTEGGLVKGSQRFKIGTDDDKANQQVITVNWSYKNGNTITTKYGDVTMPSVKISAPEFLGVSTRQLRDDEVSEGIKGAEVTARLRQTFSTVNASDTRTQVVEYEVKHYILQDIVLKKVSYRKDWEWIDRTDSTAMAFYPIVYRDRTYSDGEVFTDTFIDNPHFVSWTSSIGPERYTTNGGSWGTIIYGQAEYNNQDNVYTSSVVVGVPAIGNLTSGIVEDGYRTQFPGVWDAYTLQKQFTADMQVPKDGIEIEGEYEVCRKANGWYVFEPEYYRQLNVYYVSSEPIITLSLLSNFIDAYIVIDDFKFSFLEGRNPMSLNYSVENDTYDGYYAKRFIHEGSTTFFGKQFYVSAEAIVYQRSGSRAPENKTTRATSKQSQSRYNTLPVPYLTTPRFIYGGKPKGVKGRY